MKKPAADGGFIREYNRDQFLKKIEVRITPRDKPETNYTTKDLSEEEEDDDDNLNDHIGSDIFGAGSETPYQLDKYKWVDVFRPAFYAYCAWEKWELYQNILSHAIINAPIQKLHNQCTCTLVIDYNWNMELTQQGKAYCYSRLNIYNLRCVHHVHVSNGNFLPKRATPFLFLS